MIKRGFDILLCLFSLLIFAVPMAIVALLVKTTSSGPALYWSQRVGQNNRLFWMAKFRSMSTKTPEVATHLLGDSSSWITPLGRILRKTSLDELPQLLNILTGDMSFVGPRPGLHNQDDLIELRTALGVHELKPGLTGLAQVSGRDELLICEKVEYDRQYLVNHSILTDLSLIFQTAIGVFLRRGVKQADEETDLQSVTICEGEGDCYIASPVAFSAVAVALQHQPQAKIVCWRDVKNATLESLAEVTTNDKKVYLIIATAESSDLDPTIKAESQEKQTVHLLVLPENKKDNVAEQIKSDVGAIKSLLQSHHTGQTQT